MIYENRRTALCYPADSLVYEKGKCRGDGEETRGEERRVRDGEESGMILATQ